MSACTHPERTARYILDVRGRNVIRVEKCTHCRRIVRRKRSRWKSRSDRLNRLRVELKPPRHGCYRPPEPVPTRRERLLEAMAEVAREAQKLPQNDDRLWKYHPLAIRWRRLVRCWWALPAADWQPVTSSDREKYRALFGPAAREIGMGWNTPHANTGGHLARLHTALSIVKGSTLADWQKYTPENGYPNSWHTELPELTRKAVHAIYRALPELRKRDVPTQFNLWR